MRHLVNNMYAISAYAYNLDGTELIQPYEVKEVGGLMDAIYHGTNEWDVSGCGAHVVVTDPNLNVIVEFWPTGAEIGFNPVRSRTLS